ncbi:MAG: glycosyltransferase family 2 protein [Candidatus Dormibacteria bacterium]
MAANSLCVVIPVYNNQETIPELVRRLGDLRRDVGAPVRAVFVVDGGRDRSHEVLCEQLRATDLPAEMVIHSRNFGSFAAIRTGLAESREDFVAVMAADLQEPVSFVSEAHQQLVTGEVDVVVGVRRSRVDGWSVRLTSGIFWRLYRRVAQPAMPEGGVDVFACTAQVRDVLLSLRETNSSLVGLLIWSGFRRGMVSYDRAARTSGKSGWSMKKRVRYLLDSMYSFTDLPITLLLVVGVTGTFLSALVSLVVLVAWLLRRIDVPGYTPLMLTMLLGMSAILSGLGIVGSYVWRTYANSKLRPGSIVMAREHFNEGAGR